MTRAEATGLDVDGRIVSIRDLRTLIPRYGFEIVSLEETYGPSRVVVVIKPARSMNIEAQAMARREGSAKRFESLESTIAYLKPIGTQIEIRLVPMGSISTGPYR